MAKKNGSGGYEIGYGKPPKHSRFKPGQCGNPKGRPKGSRNRTSELEDNRLRAIIKEESERLIEIRDAKGKKQKITTKRAVMRSIVVNALKGQQRSQRLFTELVDDTERVEREERVATFETWAKYKMSASRNGQLPNPDHVKLDLEKGEVTIAGPAMKDEVASWDRWQKIREAIQAEAAELGERYDDYPEDHPEVVEIIKVLRATMLGINIALNGNRTVMKFLESIDRSEIEVAMKSRKGRRKSERKSVLFAVHEAMDAEYLRRTS